MNAMMDGNMGEGNGECPTGIATVVAPLNVLDAAYHTAHNHPGGVANLAQRMRMSPSTLNHKVSVTCQTHHLTLHESVLLQEMSGNFSVLHSMAAALGHVALKIEPIAGDRPMAEVTRMVREFSELLTSVTESVADGTVTINEMRNCQKQAMDSIGAIYSVMSSLRASMAPERRP